MHHDIHWTERDWRLTASTGSDLLVHAALRKGIQGDRASIQSMLNFCASEEGREISPSTQHDEPVNFTLRVPDKSVIREIKIIRATLVKAVAVSLSLDQESLGTGAAQNSYERVTHVMEERHERQRNTWTPEDENLMRTAIELWRDDRSALLEFVTNCARHIRHPGFVQTMIDAKLPMADLMYRSMMANGSDDDENNKSGMQLMIQAGNTRGLSLWLDSVTDLTEIQGMNIGILKDALGGPLKTGTNAGTTSYQTDESIKSQLPFTQVEEAREAAQAGNIDAMGPVTKGLVSLLKTLYRDDDEFLVGHANVLTRYLSHMDANKIERSPLFVETLLNQPTLGGLTLATALDALVVSMDRAIDTKQTIDASVKHLLLKAAATHCTPVLEAAERLISAQPTLHPELIKSAAMAGEAMTSAERQGSPLETKNFLATIKALEHAGVDIKAPFLDSARDKPAQSTFLHALAESRHKDTIDALLVALEEGFDPQVRNGRNWLASSSVVDKDTKSAWASVEKSFIARKAAASALDEILGIGLKP